jgi:hypothetical protein
MAPARGKASQIDQRDRVRHAAILPSPTIVSLDVVSLLLAG